MSSLPSGVIGHSNVLKGQWPDWDLKKKNIYGSCHKCVSQQGITGQSDPSLPAA